MGRKVCVSLICILWFIGIIVDENPREVLMCAAVEPVIGAVINMMVSCPMYVFPVPPFTIRRAGRSRCIMDVRTAMWDWRSRNWMRSWSTSRRTAV